MHYTPSVSEAFNSVEHIMRDVNNGWFLRYLHANGASFFFIFVYIHIGRGIYYGSYRSPRTLLWSIGVVIYILMMAKGLAKMYIFNEMILLNSSLAFIEPRTKGSDRIGPHNIDIISIFTGSLLGDGHINKNNNTSYRIRLEQGDIHKDYLFWLFKKIKNLGYTNSFPKKNRRNYYFYTYNYKSLYFIYDQFYIDNIKRLPNYQFLYSFLTPLALSIWIMDDGGKERTGLTLGTHSFSLKEVELLCE